MTLQLRTGLLVTGAIILVLGVSAWLPVEQTRVINYGIDAYDAHHVLFGTKKISQIVSTSYPLVEVGVIVVDYLRKNNLVPVQLDIFDAADTLLTTTQIPTAHIRDDHFAWGTLQQPLIPATAQLTLIFSAPEATSKNPVGIRFDSSDSTQMLALSLRERVPLWQAITTFITNNRHIGNINQAVIAAAIVALLSCLVWWLPRLTKQNPDLLTILKISSVALLIVSAFLIRMNFVSQLHGVSGGDPYNYLEITKSITSFDNPFSNTKRLPGYPLLLIPAWLTESSSDDTVYMRYVSVASSLGILVVLALLARALQLPWSIQWLAPALLAFQKNFFEISTRPEPYTFYTLLLLLALLFFLKLRQRWAQISLGLVLGYAAMTRQEGFVLAAVVGLASLAWFKQLGWKGYVRIYLPAFLLILPFFIHNTITFGNPIFTPYFEGDRLQIVDSWPAFTDSLGATWGIIGSLWKPAWDELERIPFTDSFLLTGFFAALGWWVYRRYLSSRVIHHPIASLIVIGSTFALLAWIIFITVQTTQPLLEPTYKIAAGVLLASIIPFIVMTRWASLPIMAVLLTQILIATWFHPFPKHYQQDYPLLMLLLATALVAPRLRPSDISPTYRTLAGITSWIQRTALLTPLALITLTLFSANLLIPHIDALNEDTALDSVLSRAVAVAQTLPAPVGFDQYYQSALLYFENDTSSYFNDHDHLSPRAQTQWLAAHPIHTLVTTNLNQAFKKLDSSWLEVAHFKAAGKKDVIWESKVYVLDNENK